ncbi:hypothetical protein F5Y03DRAFT_386204 [Xylaria venustula]|nr:hypothetical protein F5Y03DRAFT_386204 [Xylaria venustula]
MLLTHPRACSTAFERVFMTRREEFVCFNEPFADPSFFGPEACVERHDANGETGACPGFECCTFKERMDLIEEQALGKRAFVKDMAFQLSHWQPDQTPQLAKSLAHLQCDRDAGNPTVLPFEILQRHRWALLIRNPQQSIPSLFRLSATPAKREATGWRYFLPSEAGYAELRRMFDYLLGHGLMEDPEGTNREQHQGHEAMQPCVIDAEDFLQQPEKVIKAYCGYIGLDYQPSMLLWDSKEDDDQAAQVFATWTAFHRDAIESRGLQAKKAKARRSTEDDFRAWVEEFGQEGADTIQRVIEQNMPDYIYLKQFAMKV